MRARSMMYKAVVHTMIIKGSNSWVVMEVIMKLLGGLHHSVDQRIAGISDWQVGKEVWKWSLVEEILEAEGLWPMKG